VISLVLAESDFEMPKEVKGAKISVITEGRYHYETNGVEEFLEAARNKILARAKRLRESKLPY
jgi:aspartate/methionine/tyrosine aminotransferase